MELAGFSKGSYPASEKKETAGGWSSLILPVLWDRGGYILIPYRDKEHDFLFVKYRLKNFSVLPEDCRVQNKDTCKSQYRWIYRRE